MKGTLLVFTEAYARGGSNRFTIDLVNSLLETFSKIELASNHGGFFPEDLSRLGRPLLPRTCHLLSRAGIVHKLNSSIPAPGVRRFLSLALLPLEPLFLMFNVLVFLLQIVRLRPQLILSCNGGYPASHACLALVVAGFLARIPTVLSIVSVPTPRRKILWLYDWLLDTMTWGTAKLVLVNAKFIQKALVTQRGMPLRLCAVVHNGIEDQLVERIGKNNPSLVIGCVARMDAMKGVLVLLDAFIDLARRYPNVCLVLAGEGDASATIAKRVREYGLENRVSLLGHYSGSIDTLLSGFDIFAFPSFWEGLPYSILEAMRSELPIVSTRVGGIPEAVSDGVEGLLVEPNDVGAFVAAIENLINDPRLRQTLATQARTRFQRDFDLAAMHRRARLVLMEGTEI